MSKVKIRGPKSTGTFFFGFAMGIVLVVLILGGLGFWAYSQMNLAKLENMFDFTINLGNDPSGIKQMSFSELFTFVEDYTENADSVTLTDLKNDFDISITDEDNYFYGIDITSLLNIPIVNIGDNLNLISDQIDINFLETMGVEIPENVPAVEALRGTAFSELAAAIENLTVPQLFGATQSNTGILKMLSDRNATLSTLSSTLAVVLDPDSLTFADIYYIAPFELPDGETYGSLPSALKSKTLNQMMDEYITNYLATL